MNKTLEIENVIRVVQELRRSGTPVDEHLVEEQYPHLMPALGKQLRLLSRLEQAACSAKRPPQSAMPRAEDLPAEFQDDLQFLGEALGAYEFLGCVHLGGQGAVYIATHRSTKRPVAVKLLLDGPLASARQRKRFTREIEIASRLRHPNIVALYDCGEVRGRLYFTMEYVDGLPIDDFVCAHALTARAIVQLFAKVCHAVSYAHQHGVIHRDLKPANILVNDAGEPRILDFGLAKESSGAPESSSISIAGQVCGTLAYLSPEEVLAAGEPSDTRSDIYSLGIVLYELLTRGFPYAVEGQREEVRNNILLREPTSLRRALSDRQGDARLMAGDISDDLEAIVRKALHKDKDRRYQAAAEFASDLDCYLAGEVIRARRDSHYYLLKSMLRKYRTQLAIAAVLCISVSAAVIFGLQAMTRAAETIRREQMAYTSLEKTLTKIDDSMRPLAGSIEAREILVHMVTDELSKLDPREDTSSERQRVLAAVQELEGDIAFDKGTHEQAAQHYRAFLGTSLWLGEADSSNDEYLVRTARAHRKLATATGNSDDDFAKAIEIGEDLVASRTENTAAKFELCRARIDLSQQLYDAGEYERALREANTALSIAEPTLGSEFDDIDWNELLAKSYGLRGRSQTKLGDSESGIASLNEYLRIRKILSETRPADVWLRHKLFVSYANLGDAHRDGGRIGQAVDLFNEAAVVGAYLTNADPTVATWKRDLYSVHDRLSRLHLASGDFAKAESHCNSAVNLAQGLAALEPENAEWRRILGFSFHLRGKVGAKQDNWQRAHDDFKVAVAHRETISAKNQENSSVQSELAESYSWLGKCCRRLGLSEETRDYYLKAHGLERELLDKYPDVPRHALGFFASQTKLIDWHLQQDTVEDDELAAQRLGQAEKVLNDLHNSGKLANRPEKYAQWIQHLQESKDVISSRAHERIARQTP